MPTVRNSIRRRFVQRGRACHFVRTDRGRYCAAARGCAEAKWHPYRIHFRDVFVTILIGALGVLVLGKETKGLELAD